MAAPARDSTGYVYVRNGDLSNGYAPRFVFVWENLVAQCENTSVEAVAVRLHRWKYAVGLWTVNTHIRKCLWDIAFRQDYRLDLLTFRPEGFAEALRGKLDYEGLPFSNVLCSTPAIFARKLAFLPDVRAVFDADTSHRFFYGGRGRIVADPNQFSTWGL